MHRLKCSEGLDVEQFLLESIVIFELKNTLRSILCVKTYFSNVNASYQILTGAVVR